MDPQFPVHKSSVCIYGYILLYKLLYLDAHDTNTKAPGSTAMKKSSFRSLLKSVERSIISHYDGILTRQETAYNFGGIEQRITKSLGSGEFQNCFSHQYFLILIFIRMSI